MHAYDAKSNFFSEMDVLRASQNTSHRDAVFHVTLVCHVRALARAPLLLAVLSRQNAHFCYCMRIAFAYVFFSIYSDPSFHMHFYVFFFMFPLAAYLVACRRSMLKWRVCAHRMLVSVIK